MTQKTEPWFVAQQRLRKAESIAARLILEGVGAHQAVRLPDPRRRDVEGRAGVRKASDQTWRMAIEMVAGSARTTCPTCGHGDPEGIPGPPRPFGHVGPCTA